MKRISILAILLTLVLNSPVFSNEPSKKGAHDSVAAFSVNGMGLLLGAYGICAEMRIWNRLTLDVNAYYAGFSAIESSYTNGYSMFNVSIMPRYYLTGEGMNGFWMGLGAGLKFTTISKNGIQYYGNVPTFSIGGGVKIQIGNFFFEPYGGYTFGFGGVEGLPDHKGESSMYGANVGIIF